MWHAGYWSPHVGFYGGVNYGFGYDQARMSFRRLEGESRFLAIGALPRQYVTLSVPGNACSR